MNRFEEQSTKDLFDKNILTESQYIQIKAYRKLGIFSLHNELKLFLYLAVLSFTTGTGILIYQNIDIRINTVDEFVDGYMGLVVTLVCYYFSFKNSTGFRREETKFENPIYDYLILAAILLTCIFIGYLQFQYTSFGTHYGLATLIPSGIALFCAYYFDNKSILSIAITGLAAYIGLTVSPQALLNNDLYNSNTLSYSAIGLGFVLILWAMYSNKIALKKHFTLVYLTFGLHLISISCLNNLFQPYWFVFIIILAASLYYFYNASYQFQAVSLFVFSILYAYIAANIVIIKIITAINIGELIIPFFFVVPIYFVGSIIIFIKLIKQFNQQKNQ